MHALTNYSYLLCAVHLNKKSTKKLGIFNEFLFAYIHLNKKIRTRLKPNMEWIKEETRSSFLV